MIHKVLRFIDRCYAASLRRYKIAKYSRLGPEHVFDIKLDDMAFKMTFGKREIGPAIVDRIEGKREPSTTALMRGLVRPGSHVLELGGCYGEFTIVLSKCAGPEGRVVSIEGTPNNYAVLQRNIELNNLTNVTAYKYFITSKTDQVQFEATENDPYGAIQRLNAGSKNGLTNAVSVPTVQLSTLLEEIKFSPDIIFMDIEGFEIDVFKDFSNIGYFLFHRPVIVFEIHEMFYDGQEDLAFIKKILDQDYYCYRQVVKNLVCLPQRIPL